MFEVKIATAPCSWGVWYADGTPSGTPWELFLDQAAEAGYQALELGPDGYLPTEESRLLEELGKRNLSVCAGTACYAFDQGADFAAFRPRTEALCRRLTALGAKYLVTMDESDVGARRRLRHVSGIAFSGKSGIWGSLRNGNLASTSFTTPI